MTSLKPPVRQVNLLRQGAFTYVASASTLAINLLTGIIVARGLGASGRGELTATMAVPPLVGWAFVMGASVAIQYHQAKHPEDASRLLSTWYLLSAPLLVLALIVGELLLPVIFAAQTSEALHLARLYLLTVVLVFLGEVNFGVLLGDHDFLFFNVMKILQPATVAVLYVLLWWTRALSVRSALLATVFVGAGTTAIAMARVLRRHGLSQPSFPLARSTLWYGVRGHGSTLSSILNERLDLLILPTFLTASSIGIYAIAGNVSWIVVSVAGSLATLVLPAAAREGSRGPKTVLYSVHATICVSTAIAVPFALSADFALRLIYGNAFAMSGLPLRILLPGSALYAAASTLRSGLYAANRPLMAAASQATGLAITIPGLIIFLRHGGVLAAALVSTCAYAAVFIAAAFFYRRVASLAWQDFLPTREEWIWLRHAPGAAAKSLGHKLRALQVGSCSVISRGEEV